MNFNWQKAAVGAGAGLLSGYSTVLQEKAKADMEQRKQDAMFQREKSLAKYRSDLSMKEREDQRLYTESQRGSGLMMGDREITLAEKEKMTPEQLAGLKSKSDYAMDQAMSVQDAKDKRAIELAEKQRDTTKKWAKEDLEEAINKTLDVSGVKDEDREFLKEAMMAEGATTPSQLRALMSPQGKPLGGDAITSLIRDAGKRADEILETGSEDTIKDYARNLGWEGADVNKAASFLQTGDKLKKALFTQDLQLTSGGTKTSSLLNSSLPSVKKEKEVKLEQAAISMVSSINKGDVTLEEVKQRNPVLYNRIKNDPNLINQVTVEPEGRKKFIGNNILSSPSDYMSPF
jgi:hypothetical protein